MKKYYVRVSTAEQKIDRQLLAYPGADRIYIDKMSGATKERPQLLEMLAGLEKSDIVIVKSLDRLSRSTFDLLEIVKEIESKGANLKIIDKNIDTGDAMGKFFITVLGAVAELERANIRQRTKEGIAIAKKQGKFKGRKKGSISIAEDQIERFVKLYNLGMSKTDLAKEFGISRPAIYRWIDELKRRGAIKQ